METENPHIGSAFDSFPAEEGMLEEVARQARERVIEWQNQRIRQEEHPEESRMDHRG